MSNSGIPGYKILKLIGKGGTSKVFLAIQISVGRTIAVKVLSKELSQDLDFSQQFLKEANCGVLNHPNIITIHDAGESNGHLYIAMEHLSGGDLKLKMQQGISEDEVIRIITQIARALSHAHSNNFTHRDIKPGNILFDEHDNAILADFGIAKTLRFAHDNSIISGFIGTPNYISPEQVSEQPVDHRSDLYSLGVVYYEILTGVKPFTADSTYTLIFKHLKEPVPPLAEKYQCHQAIINKLLEKKPDDRYQSANELIKDLENIKNPVIAEPIEPAKKSSGNALRNSSVLVILLIALSSVIYTQLQPAKIKLKIPESVAIKSSMDKKTIEKLEEYIKKTAAQNVLLEQEQRSLKAITSHLTNASKYLGLNQLISPQNKNALYEFQQVLLLDEDNTQAQYGIQYIINYYKERANDARNNHHYDDSIDNINTGLTINSNDAELLAMHKEVSSLMALQTDDKKIHSGLKRADRFIRKNKLIDAKLELHELNRLYKNNKAIKSKLAFVKKKLKREKYINHALVISTSLLKETPLSELNLSEACENGYSLIKLNPENKKVKKIINTCANQYLNLARQATTTEEAIELTETGLYYNPNNPELSLYLQELLTSEPTSQKKRTTN